MSMSPHWTRWIHASISDLFTDFGKKTGFHIYIEAQDRIKIENFEDLIEVRWDGPFASEISRNYWRLDIEVNLLISSKTGRTDTHQHKKVVGKAQEIIPRDFPIYKFGTNPEIDDQQLLGCFQLRTDDREGIIKTYFGKIDVEVSLEQTTIEAHYRMHLKI